MRVHICRHFFLTLRYEDRKKSENELRVAMKKAERKAADGETTLEKAQEELKDARASSTMRGKELESTVERLVADLAATKNHVRRQQEQLLATEDALTADLSAAHLALAERDAIHREQLAKAMVTDEATM